MRKVPVSYLVPGMRLARPVLGTKGEVYLNAGVTLSRRYIERLGEIGFPAVYVEDNLLNGVEIRDVISEKTRRDAITQVRRILTAPSSPKARVLNADLALATMAESIVTELLKNPLSVVNLVDIRAEGAYLYHHSVNVCILAVLTGINFGLHKEQLLDLALGALLHDVGKIKVNPDILNKPGALTAEEFEHVKQHCAYGRDILKEHRVASMIAYAHHERYNGEGYPLGLKEREIGFQPQLVGIADVYDALTSDRCYRKAVLPHEALEMIAGAGNWWFDVKLVHNFLRCVAAYPTGTLVEVSSGEIGIVLDTPQSFTFFPNVRVLLNANGEKVLPYHLSTVENNLWVSRVLGEEEAEVVRKMLDHHGS
jgi:HD-GYP domain-containing protein (c-di-GMP phosphodiesterase class II)